MSVSCRCLSAPPWRENQAYIAARLEELMNGYHKPELVVGVEWIGMYAAGPIPGPATNFFADLARRYGIYLIPGTMSETSPELPEGQFYNAAPIFGPDGRLIDVYRKMAPYRPAEPAVPRPQICGIRYSREADQGRRSDLL